MNSTNADLIHMINEKRSRRSALRKLGAGVLGMGALGMMGAAPRAQAGSAAGPGQDAAVLNFALNLEYLEGQYYTYATTGAGLEAKGIGTSGSGTPGTVTIKSGAHVPFATNAIEAYANEIALDEQRHVTFLRSALTNAGVTPVAQPAINLLDSFNTLAAAANISSSGFDPFSSETNFLVGAYIFEDVGVTAYHGGAALITSKDYLTAAAGILGTEAYHAGLIRLLLYQLGNTTIGYSQKISALRATLDGTNSDDQGVQVNSMSNLVNGDSNSLVYSRTTRQVLNIVYGAVNASSGLFYPNGLNGAIH